MSPLNTLFAILNVSSSEVVEARLRTFPSWPTLKLKEGEWLLVAPSSTTSKEIADSLGMTTTPPDGQSKTNGIVVRVENYFGLGPPSNWEWIRTKLGASLGANA